MELYATAMHVHQVHINEGHLHISLAAFNLHICIL